MNDRILHAHVWPHFERVVQKSVIGKRYMYVTVDVEPVEFPPCPSCGGDLAKCSCSIDARVRAHEKADHIARLETELEALKKKHPSAKRLPDERVCPACACVHCTCSDTVVRRAREKNQRIVDLEKRSSLAETRISKITEDERLLAEHDAVVHFRLHRYGASRYYPGDPLNHVLGYEPVSHPWVVEGRLRGTSITATSVSELADHIRQSYAFKREAYPAVSDERLEQIATHGAATKDEDRAMALELRTRRKNGR